MEDLILKIGKFKNLGTTAKSYLIVYTGIASDSITFSVFLQTLGKVDITFPIEDKILEINENHYIVIELDASFIKLRRVEQEQYNREINEKMIVEDDTANTGSNGNNTQQITGLTN